MIEAKYYLRHQGARISENDKDIIAMNKA